MSLARKLSILTGAVIALCLLIVFGVAYEVLTRSAVSGASERLIQATQQLANLAETGLRQNRTRYSAAAHDTAVRGVLARASSSAGQRVAKDTLVAAAEKVMATLEVPADSGLPIELWSTHGQRVAVVGSVVAVVPESPSDAQVLGPPRFPRAGVDDVSPVDSLQIGRLYASGGRVYYWLVQPVMEQRRAVGYIAQQRRLASNAQAERSVRALAGEGVSLYYHNADGSAWSTLGGSPTTPSRRDLNTPDHATRGNEEVLIANAAVTGSPIVIAMESRLRDVLTAPRKTLRQLLLVGIVMLLLGMGAALLIGRGVAKPIVAIADGAEAIARGEYDTRVPAFGDVEIERLAHSFNHMANEVAASQRALQQKTADAQAANRAKSEFLATVSHELRTPLNAIAGYTELLEMELRGPLTDAQRRDLARIRASGQHLLGLISSVLDLNRIERGQVSYDLVPIAIEHFLRDLDALISPQAAAKSLTLEYVPSAPSLTVIADREKLRQIILNLLSNAIRFTPGGGRITLSSADVSEAEVRVYVQDTGPGIPEVRREHVFEPFVQLDRSLTRTQEGLGLGLSISRDLARGMHGDLQLANNASGGATFMLTLPRYSANQASEVAAGGGSPAYRE
jgi:signal transduction histidine kinase